MDADIFVSGKKKLRIQKYPDTCGRGLNVRKTKRIAKFDGLEPRCCEDIKGIVTPEKFRDF